ncbi:MAG: DNA mismatch repair endonuclease MutL [Oscillatoria sp. SIO1A7]|nr:DNA mismatch repair endonuclease MutL [Oscillatoria sp. SIO1A7]
MEDSSAYGEKQFGEDSALVMEDSSAYGQEQFGEKQFGQDSALVMEDSSAYGEKQFGEDSGQTDLEKKSTRNLPRDNQKENRLSLAMGLPDRCHRRRPDWVKVAVNGRLVRSPELEQVAIGAFGRTLPRDRYPLCFLDLKVTADQIDWNRHPAKEEIYLQNLSWWQEKIKEAIALALRLNAEAAPAAAQDRIVGLLKASEEKGSYRFGRSQQEKASNPLQLRAIAQLHNTYILAEHPSGVWLVEQHIAHERILYEQLQASWQLVPLEAPAILANLSKAQLEQLERLELDTSEFGDRLWAVRSAPELLVEREDCTDALYELSLAGDLEAAQVATACRSAIRNGTPLTLPEMQDILDRWQQTSNPRTCPHGRPIYLPLEETDLARFFRRHWVIGKSHGI